MQMHTPTSSLCSRARPSWCSRKSKADILQKRRKSTTSVNRCARKDLVVFASSDEQLRSVVITGASSGIGRAAAKDLAERGWHVFAGVRRKEDAAALQAEEPRITPLMIDVLDQSSISAAAEEVAEAVGERGLHGVVNCAGMALITPLEMIPSEEFNFVYDVNVTGALRTTQSFLPLIRAGQGRIVNIGSQAGTLAYPGFGAYNCSKFALEGFSDTLRMEMKHFGVEVCHVAPGAVKTAIWERGNENSNAIMAKVSSHEAASEYQELFRQCIAGAAKAESKGCSTEDTSAAIIHALEAYKPQTRYIVGKSARLMVPLRKFIPDRIFDMLVLGTLQKMSAQPRTNFAVNTQPCSTAPSVKEAAPRPRRRKKQDKADSDFSVVATVRLPATLPHATATLPLAEAVHTYFPPEDFPSISSAKKVVRRGEILVDGKRRKCNWRVEGGEILQRKQRMVSGARLDIEEVPPEWRLRVLYEDEHMAVVEKPPGISTVDTNGWTVQRLLPYFLRPTCAPGAIWRPRT
ncbi:hypothetical protein CYMTET_45920, partial [Cymbomonas tetramitiformis]